MTTTIQHPLLGLLKGIKVSDSLTQFRSIRYASIPHRFARSILSPPPTQNPSSSFDKQPLDYTTLGPCSIQPFNSTRTDAESNQLPTDDLPPDEEEQAQSEDCLRLTITRPTSLPNDDKLLPVLVFLHGGAFFLGSGERPAYSPLTLCHAALSRKTPIIYVSVNYRLGALGFLHSPSSGTSPPLVEANNGLHDQIRAFEWLRFNIAGFGGDASKITALGQSAGAESLSLHNISGREEALYKRAIMLSGSPVTMPSKTPAEHEETFRELAGKLGIRVEGRTSVDVALEMRGVDVGRIRDLAWVGAPCSSSEILPYQAPTQRLSSEGPAGQVGWLESVVVSSCTYDGSISYIMTKQDGKKKKGHAESFAKIAREVLRDADGFLDIYGFSSNEDGADDDDDDDDGALRKICLFESDVGFFLAARAVVDGFDRRRAEGYFQVFDLGNPFEGLLEAGRFASHTWDVVALLGAYEGRLSERYRAVIGEWREMLLGYVVTGEAPWGSFRRHGVGLHVGGEGVVEYRDDELLGQRRLRLLALAEKEMGPDGCDHLWFEVGRRWLMS